MAGMHTMDCMPAALTFDLRARAARVLRGSPMRTTYVGSYKDKVTLAQIPPASGDAWCIDCSLRRGAYLMTLEGWTVDGRIGGEIPLNRRAGHKGRDPTTG